MLSEKLNDQQMKDFGELASDRTGDAVMSVLQLVDDPAQAAAIVTYVSARLVTLAAMFEHTGAVLDGSNKSHDAIVAELTYKLTEKVRLCEPTKMQRAGMEALRKKRLRRHN